MNVDLLPLGALYPDCPRCGNNRQVWVNQLTGVMTCHRAGCHTEIHPPNASDRAAEGGSGATTC
jgi:hypothetical protein